MDETDQEPVALGAALREKREAAGLSLADMAKRVHYDRSSLSRIELGQRIPRDIAHLVRAYDELKPLPTVTAATAEPASRRRIRRAQRALFAFLAAKWTVLVVVGVTGSAEFDTELLRISVAATAVALGAVGLYWSLASGTSLARRLLTGGAALAMVGLCIITVSRIGKPLEGGLTLGLTVVTIGLDAMLVGLALNPKPPDRFD